MKFIYLNKKQLKALLIYTLAVLLVNCEKETVRYPEIGISVDSINFGNVKVDHKSIYNVSISNHGSGELIISLIKLDGSSEYWLLSKDYATLSQSSSCIVSIIFSPTSTGQKSTKLIILSNDPAYPSLTVNIEGNGIIMQAVPGPWFGKFQNGYIYFNVSEDGNMITAHKDSVEWNNSFIIKIPLQINNCDTDDIAHIYYFNDDISIENSCIDLKETSGHLSVEGVFESADFCNGSACYIIYCTNDSSKGCCNWTARPCNKD